MNATQAQSTFEVVTSMRSRESAHPGTMSQTEHEVGKARLTTKVCEARLALMVDKETVKDIFDHLVELKGCVACVRS